MLEQFQYRAANYFYMIGMVTEPIVYLVVWSTIARSQGGSVGGYTAETFAAYYIVWTLVRNMNIVFTPFGWEERIREGTLSGQLVRPMHPIHYDLGFFAGWKVVVIVLWLPIAAVLDADLRSAARPPTTADRRVLRRHLGCVPDPVVPAVDARNGHVLDHPRQRHLRGCTSQPSCCCRAASLPLDLMPEWAQDVAAFLPFQWTFGYPITALVGPISDRDLYLGLLAQAGWIAAGALGVWWMWRHAVRRYTAVAG